jgi:Ring finger domain
MRMMMMGGNPISAIMVQSQEEERALQRAIEESRRQNQNDPDNMTYEQLLELGDRLGKVSKGLTKEQIAKIPSKLWRPGVTKQASCSICFEDFTIKNRVKLLTECGHEYHDQCINKWFENEKRCPVCNKTVNIE